ncbi:MAG TPA: response regulator transcription factor [Gaiellaceae bacterium]|nr:response regulator transcription factor [Gaiellaceae bacterium]
MPATVLIADDHTLFAEALEAILSADGRVQVVGRASNGDEAVRLDATLRPDVVLMDISMPVMDGIEATAKIAAKRPEARILILTGSDAPADIDAARRAGAAGYVTKDRIAAELVQAILDATAG